MTYGICAEMPDIIGEQEPPLHAYQPSTLDLVKLCHILFLPQISRLQSISIRTIRKQSF